MRRPAIFAFAFGLVLVGALVGWATSGERERPQPPAQAFDRDLAKSYVDAQCWQCHAVSTLSKELAETLGAQAAGQRPTGPDLAGIAGLYPDAWHRANFHEPASVVAFSQMPAHRDLAQADRVIEFLQTLDLPSDQRAPWPRSRKTPPPGDAARGKALFAHYCAGCHGEAADGKGRAARFFTEARIKPPSNIAGGQMVWRSAAVPVPTPRDLFETLSNGRPGSGMPSFAAKLTERQRADLVAHIVALLPDDYATYTPLMAEKELALEPPKITRELIERGRVLFADTKVYQCADCHGNAGKGDGPLAASVLQTQGFKARNLVDERLRRGDLAGVYASIALGLGRGMAGYRKDDGSNDDDLWALAAHVRGLNRWEK